MFEGEAIRLRELLTDLPSASPLLHLGSSTRRFREVDKPHIHRELFGPLEELGIAVVHSDLKQADGVDMVGDVCDPAVRERLKQLGFRAIIAANLLEHVRDRDAVIAACEEIVGPGGYILATVPSSFPYHADPIDTGFRPSPVELAAAFVGSRPLAVEEVAGRTYAEDIVARGSSVWKEMAQTLFFGLICFVRPRSFAARVHRWRWYNRPYRVSVALLSVDSPGG